MKKLKPTIGMEVHIELSTKSKMFCRCPAEHFGKKPNTLTCPVCLGLPGALPVPNKKAVDYTIIVALALNCKIAKSSKFDRKHYSYPDLPKGYQISQLDEPIGVNGFLNTSQGKIRIKRVHLEEDTGKLKHREIKGKDVTLIDFNRSGVPLVEIVTEPDIKSAGQAKEYTRELQRIVRSLKVSGCDMEKGSMRLEANISLGKDLGYKVEVKNLNSHRFVEKAIEYEIVRQIKLLKKNEIPVQETRGWSVSDGKTVLQRIKESEADYRYFPEPDIPPMEFSESYINELKQKIPKLPDKLAKDLVNKFGIKSSYAQLISIDENLCEFALKSFKLAKAQELSLDTVAGQIVNKKIDPTKTHPKEFIKSIFDKKMQVIDDEKTLMKHIRQIVRAEKSAVASIKNGNVNAIQVLMGAVMKRTKGKADPKKVRLLLEKFLNL